MPVLGRACLILGLAVAIYGIAAGLYGARTGRRELVESARRSVYALFGLMTVAFGLLEIAFLRSDFSFDVVASHSSTSTPTFYKATAVWSSQEGSLLLWVWLLSGWSSLMLFLNRRRLRDVTPYACAVLLAFGAFFCALLVVKVSPFTTTSPAPPEGAGLNPLLRHPSMMIHPPTLYSGYTLFAVPFAFAIGALAVRRIDAEWIRATRRFALAAWFLLGVGILLGARWSYSELGWGGYWAWDPVENASLMPWLTGTAFLHSVMIQEKRGMLRVWNVSLVLATGVLAVLGTFLVRSGILESIHAFGASTVGGPFLALISLMIAGSIALVVSRRGVLRSEGRLDSLLSREAVFLLNNLVLVGLCFVVFWLTFLPIVSEAITGRRLTAGPEDYSPFIVPLALVLVLLSGIGPVIAWRRTTLANARRAFALPVCGLVAVGALALALGAGDRPLALAMFALAGFVVVVIGQELWRGVRARRAMANEPLAIALVQLVRRNRRRYGGYLVHVGISVLFVGVAASSAFQHAEDVKLSPGQTASVGGYDVRYVRPTTDLDGERIALGADLELRRDGKKIRTLHTERGYYPSNDPTVGRIGRFFEGEATSEVGLEAGFTRDVWTAIRPDLEAMKPFIDEADQRFDDASPDLQAFLVGAIAARYEDRPPPATFRVIVSPMVSWIWLGGLIVFAGALIALWPQRTSARRELSAAYLSRLARELGSRERAAARA